MTTYEISLDWDRLHAACHEADQARGRNTYLGYDGTVDVFGGSYFAPSFHRRGVAGAVVIVASVRKLMHDCWDAVRDARVRVDDAAKPKESDYVTEWLSVDCGVRADMVHRTHRGAAHRAAMFGGKVESRRVLQQRRVDERVRAAKDRVRRAIRCAIACHESMTVLAEAGLVEYYPSQHICGVHNGKICLTGIRWARGENENDLSPTIEEALSLYAGE